MLYKDLSVQYLTCVMYTMSEKVKTVLLAEAHYLKVQI